ncbi:MAG: hypothetical protein S4CHLAM123_02010 [Chlamydiales bacterium]|nr:hypothetical protein [Chlamydiales bacterium]
MSSIPPSSGNNPPSNQPAKDKSVQGKGKEFKLPKEKQRTNEKKGRPQGKEEEPKKKKNILDVAGDEAQVQQKQPGVQQDIKTAELKSEQVAASIAKGQVDQVGKLIQRMVGSLRIGEIDGQNLASLNLKQVPEVPESFAGSNLTLSYHEGALAIRFDNFMTPQQENTAITMVEKNKEQLEQMIQNLAAKNIHIAEMRIGEHVITLPEVQALPRPFETTAAFQPQTRQQQQQQQEKEDQEPQE